MEKNYKVVSPAEFAAIIKENKIKFTKPQQFIVDLLLKGHKIQIVNEHRNNGGEWMWKYKDSEHLGYAGHVYKAFWGIQRSVEAKCDFSIHMGLSFIVQK